MEGYRLLLRFYPASFRHEYGEEMCRLFEERRRLAAGLPGALAVWFDAVADTLVNAARVHLDVLRQDLRWTRRGLARSPGFAMTAVLLTALGVGATTATYTVTDHVLLRALPYVEPDRLVKLWQDETPRGYPRMEPSPANYRDWKRMAASFAGMAAYTARSTNLSGTGDPERLEATLVTANLFPLLGAQPALGRLFTSTDDADRAACTAILSDHLWRARFARDAAILGRTVLLDGERCAIVGVMPPGFAFPTREADLWTPMRFAADAFEDRTNNYLQVVARLKPGATLERAQAEMRTIAARLARAFPKENAESGVTLRLLGDQVPSQARLLLVALLGASLCVLLIVCTNLANLLLARTLARRQELAVRAAMGAGRERLVRQLLTESVVLGTAGGALGVLVALAAQPLVSGLVPVSLPIAATPGVDLRILAFAAFVTGATGVGFGVIPSLRACRQADASTLREGPRGGGSRRVERLRSALVIAEVSACVVLLVTTGLLVRALWRVQQVDPGFHPENVLTLRTALPLPKYDSTDRRQQFYDRVLSQVRGLPGVSEAAYISFAPMTMRGGIWPVEIDGRSAGTVPYSASLRFVTPRFFASLQIPLRAGRDLADADTRQAPFVAVVSKSFARQHWPGTSPLGRRFRMAFAERTIVGVVGDIRVRGLERLSEPQVYVPSRQVADGALPLYMPKDLVVRSATAPGSLIPAIRRIVAAADPQQPISDVRMLTDIVDAETAPRLVQARVLGAFAIIAFVLAAVGIHGLLAFTVSSRLREFAVRMALGARPGTIRAMVVRQAFVLGGAGAVAGVVLAYAASRTLTALLAGVDAADLPTLAVAVVFSLAMTLGGSIAPALRAVRIDPMEAIRAE